MINQWLMKLIEFLNTTYIRDRALSMVQSTLEALDVLSKLLRPFKEYNLIEYLPMKFN